MGTEEGVHSCREGGEPEDEDCEARRAWSHCAVETTTLPWGSWSGRKRVGNRAYVRSPDEIETLEESHLGRSSGSTMLRVYERMDWSGLGRTCPPFGAPFGTGTTRAEGDEPVEFVLRGVALGAVFLGGHDVRYVVSWKV